MEVCLFYLNEARAKDPKSFHLLVCFVTGKERKGGCNLAIKQAEQGIDLGVFKMVELTVFGN